MRDRSVMVFLGLAALLAGDLEAARAQEPGVGPDPAGEAQPDRVAILSLWRNTLETAWGWKGPYLLDRAGKAALGEELASAVEASKEASDPVARLLRMELRRLERHVDRILPMEEAGWSGGSLVGSGIMGPWIGSLQVRQPLLEALAEKRPPAAGCLVEFLPHLVEELNEVESCLSPLSSASVIECVNKVGAFLARLSAGRTGAVEWAPGFQTLLDACGEALALQGVQPKPGLAPEALDALDRRLEGALRLACRLYLAGDLDFGECRLLLAELCRLRLGIDWQRRLLWGLPCQPYFLFGTLGPVGALQRLRWLPTFALAEAEAGRLQRPVVPILLCGMSQDLALLRGCGRDLLSMPDFALDSLQAGAQKLAARFGLELPPGESGAADRRNEAPLAQDPSWRRIQAAWAEAEELDIDRKVYYGYLYTRHGQDRLRFTLQVASDEAAVLAEAGRLAASEAAFIRQTLKECAEVAGTFDFPTTLIQPSSFAESRGERRFERIERRIPILRNLAREEALSSEVLESILESSIQDLVILAQWTPSIFWFGRQISKRQAEDEETRRRLARNDPAEWAKSTAQVEALLQELLPRPGGHSRGLAQEPRWTGIAGVLGAAFEASGTMVDGPVSRLNALDKNLIAARLDACRLAIAGVISLPELRLLMSVMERQRQCLDIERHRLRFASRTPQDLDGDRRSMS